MTTRTSDLKSLAIRLTKGNELTSFVTEDFQKDMFQTTIAAAMESTKVVRVRNTVAVLGARGDYLDLVGFVTVGTAAEVPIVSTMYIGLLTIPVYQSQYNTLSSVSIRRLWDLKSR